MKPISALPCLAPKILAAAVSQVTRFWCCTKLQIWLCFGIVMHTVFFKSSQLMLNYWYLCIGMRSGEFGFEEEGVWKSGSVCAG